MFLHLGGEKSVLKKQIIGIFDYDLIKKSRITKEFMDIAINENLIEQKKNGNKIKSFILTTDKIYFSPISSVTLQKRVVNYDDRLSKARGEKN